LRDADGTQWDRPCIQDKRGLSEAWLSSLTSLVTSMHDEDRCPMIVTPENQGNYPEFEKLGVSSFISATISHEGDTLGLLVLCSQDPTPILSFDDLALVESLKETISLRLHDQQTQKIKAQFLENAFHNLKAPVHSIAGIIEKLCTDSKMALQ